MRYLQDPAATDEAIAVALGGADYDWNRWDGRPQTPSPPPHLKPSKTLKHRLRKQKKHSQLEQEHQHKQEAGFPVAGDAAEEVEEEGSSGHGRKGRTTACFLSAQIYAYIYTCICKHICCSLC